MWRNTPSEWSVSSANLCRSSFATSYQPYGKKTKKRSIEVIQRVLPTYNAGRKPEVPVLSCPDQKLSTKGIQVQLIDFVWALAQYLNRNVQTLSSWTGFNMLTRRNKQVQKDTVGYLPTIDAPATQMNTLFEILNNANSIKKALTLKSMVVVIDQAIHAQTIEISWKHQELFQDLVLRLGICHTIGMLLAVIGQRVGAAGLRDIIVKSKVIAEGSVEKILNGKHYNRAVRFQKLMFEACMMLIWESFVN